MFFLHNFDLIQVGCVELSSERWGVGLQVCELSCVEWCVPFEMLFCGDVVFILVIVYLIRHKEEHFISIRLVDQERKAKTYSNFTISLIQMILNCYPDRCLTYYCNLFCKLYSLHSKLYLQ
jgi:hypothetical protein